MKKFITQVLVLILAMLPSATTTQAQIGTNKWQYSNPKPFGFLCYQMAYADNNTAVAVGEAGGIAKTTDGGATWAYFAYTTNNAAGEVSRPVFNDVQFVTPSLAYAVGNDGIMIKSIDGGNNWSLVSTPFYAGQQEINTVYFTDANTGYIGGDGDAITRQATMYKTTNAGASWQPFYQFPAPGTDWVNGTIYKIRFTSTGVGYVGGAGGAVWKYDNGNWLDYSITDSTIFPNVNATDTVLFDNYNGGFDTLVSTYDDNTFGLQYQNYRALAILNDSVVVVGTQNNAGLIRINTSDTTGSFLLLNNGSATSPKYYPLGSPQIYNLVTKNGITVAGAAEGGKMLLTNDRGFTWESRDVYPAGSDEAGIQFFGIDISPAGRFGLCGQAGIIADSLTQWRRPFRYVKKIEGGSYSIETISFANANYGIAAGSGGGMMRTSDGGNNWEDISNASFNPQDYYTSIAYISPTILLAAASNGMFYKSFDRGSSFDLLFTEGSSGNLTAMNFINEDTGWLAANITYTDTTTYENTFHQIIYRTTDGGNTWDSSNTIFPTVSDYSLNNYLYEIKFLNASLGYAAGVNGSIFKSTDGGITWNKLNNLPAFALDKTFNSIAIVDTNIAYASGEQALVLKTTDGGASWAVINNGLPGSYNRYPKILMYDASQGLLFGRGAVYATTDGGASWVPYYVPNAGILGTATFISIPGCTTGICNKVFAGTGDGNILKLDADIVLPVKFSNLTGSGTSRGNQLFWTAFSQEGVQYFEIQRSTDGVSFQNIGDKVYPGRFTQQAYQWLDANTISNKNFYRIKAVENTGAIFYTNIVVIANRKATDWNHQVSYGTLILTNADVQKGAVLVQVINPAGQVVAAKSWEQNGGAFNDMVVLPPTAKGIYFVRVNNEGVQKNFQIFIQ